MGQSQEARRPQREEDCTETDNEQARKVGNQALKEESEKARKMADLIEELLGEEEFSEGNAERLVQEFEQAGGQ